MSTTSSQSMGDCDMVNSRYHTEAT